MSTSAEQFTFARVSIQSLLLERALATPGATAIRGLLRDPLTFERLLAEVEYTRKSLRSFGVNRGDRVAIILPNGPEAAVCCFAVACAATSAPLNPAYSAAEFEFYLSDLKPER
jgi:acyl-CoA synthetase (AMP-forming)/AMP-acid ligase II